MWQVLVTLPLGVLQAESVQFDPPLHPVKSQALKGLGMGSENRVAMVFDKVSCPRNNNPNVPNRALNLLSFSNSRI